MVSVESFFAVIFRKKVLRPGGEEDPDVMWSVGAALAGDGGIMNTIMNFALKVEFQRPFFSWSTLK